MADSAEVTGKLIRRARYHLDTFETYGGSYRIALALNNLTTALDEAKWAEEHADVDG